MFHGNLAECCNTGQHVTSPELPADQIGPRSRINGEIALWCTDVNVLKKMCCSDLETLSSLNNLEINTLKTLEMTVDFRRNPPALPPLTIMNSTVNAVESFRFLGTTISQDLKWDDQIYSIVKKVQQRLYSLLQLRKFNLPQELLKQFYSSIIEFVLCTSITVWFNSATKIWPQKTTEGSPDCWANHWYNPQLYLSRVRKRAGKISLTSPLWTVTV